MRRRSRQVVAQQLNPVVWCHVSKRSRKPSFCRPVRPWPWAPLGSSCSSHPWAPPRSSSKRWAPQQSCCNLLQSVSLSTRSQISNMSSSSGHSQWLCDKFAHLGVNHSDGKSFCWYMRNGLTSRINCSFNFHPNETTQHIFIGQSRLYLLVISIDLFEHHTETGGYCMGGLMQNGHHFYKQAVIVHGRVQLSWKVLCSCGKYYAVMESILCHGKFL